MFKMKNLSLFLALALVGLMYHTPAFLKDLSNNMFGKLLLVVALAYITIQCEFACAVIFALIIIVLMHNTTEGYEGGTKKDDKNEDKKEDKNESPDDKKAKAGKKRIKELSKKGSALRQKSTSEAKKANTVDKQEKGKDGKFTNREPFAGEMISNVRDGLLNAYNEAQDIFKSNLLDLDREMKAGAEKRSINATKQ